MTWVLIVSMFANGSLVMKVSMPNFKTEQACWEAADYLAPTYPEEYAVVFDCKMKGLQS